MKIRAIALAGATLLWATGAQAASLCNCCGDATAAACVSACAQVKAPAGQCVASVDYAGRAEIARDLNPLYDVTLRNVRLGSPSRIDLERFRRLMERARKGVERDRRAAFRAFHRGTIDRPTMDAREKRYEDAMVNYYLGIKAYAEAKTSP